MTPPHAHVADGDRSFGVVNVQLQPAQALEVEGLESFHAFAADEAGPGIKMRVQERRAAHLVRLVHQQFDGRSRRGFDGEAGPADHLLGKLERQRGATWPSSSTCHWPGAVSTARLSDCLERVGRAELEVLLRGSCPLQPERFGQLGEPARSSRARAE